MDIYSLSWLAVFLGWGHWSRMGKETVVCGLSSLASLKIEALALLHLCDSLDFPIFAFSSSQLLLQPLFLAPVSSLKPLGPRLGKKAWGCELPQATGPGLRTQILDIVSAERLRTVSHAYVSLVKVLLGWAVPEPEEKENPVILILPSFNILIFCSSWNFGWILIFLNCINIFTQLLSFLPPRS